MIFVVTGTTKFPFNRLVLMMDELVSSGYITDEVVVQSGAFSGDAPSLTLIPYIEKEQFDRYFQEASLIISHAGMGVIFTALDMNKPILLMPRRAEFGEHVNDHQVETATAMAQKIGISVCSDSDSVKELFVDYKDFSKFLPHGSDRGRNLSELPQTVEPLCSEFPMVITASAGGHMIQLLRLIQDFKNCHISHCITTHRLQKKSLEKLASVSIVGECSRKTPLRMIKVFFQTAKLAKELKPKVVLSTGALPSAFFCYHAHRHGAKIIWVDSIANIQQLSMSGRFVKKFATTSFTQWEKLADHKTLYKGSLL